MRTRASAPIGILTGVSLRILGGTAGERPFTATQSSRRNEMPVGEGLHHVLAGTAGRTTSLPWIVARPSRCRLMGSFGAVGGAVSVIRIWSWPRACEHRSA